MADYLKPVCTCPRLYVLDGVQSGVGHLTVALLDMTYKRHERHTRMRMSCNVLCEKFKLYYSGLERMYQRARRVEPEALRWERNARREYLIRPYKRHEHRIVSEYEHHLTHSRSLRRGMVEDLREYDI